MYIDKNLLNIGVDEFVIKHLLSKTKRHKDAIVESVTWHISASGILCFKATINTSMKRKTVTLHADKSKIRDIKINSILNEVNI